MMTREKKTAPHQQTVPEMLDDLTRDGSLQRIGSRCSVPITEDDHNAAIVKALKVKDPNRFESKHHLFNWMTRVMTNESVDRFRKDQRQRSMPNTSLSQFVHDRLTVDRSEVVWSCLKNLPVVERGILHASYYDNLTDGELAEMLFGINTPAASQRARRLRLKALALLKEKLVRCEM